MSAAEKFLSTEDRISNFVGRISKLMEAVTGVQLGLKQEPMVRARLFKRALTLGFQDLIEYEKHFDSNVEEEKKNLVSLITTHHTFFFREFQHFEYLEKTLLPRMIPEISSRPNKTLRVWSAAASRGQESYSLAMFLYSFTKRYAPNLKYEIFGTDIDSESIEIAANGVYGKEEIREAPLHFLGQHWARGTGDIENYVKAKPSLKDNCKFGVLNLLGEKISYPKEKFDIIFCRNVFIYFNAGQIKEIMERLNTCLAPGGSIFLGVSESLNGIECGMESIGPSIYQRKLSVFPEVTKSIKIDTTKNDSGDKSRTNIINLDRKIVSSDKPKVEVPIQASKPIEQPSGPIKVFTIDDSSTIQTILKQVFGKDSDFTLIGSAVNGKDAMEKLKSLKPDVITLDIHMPEMTGIEYLKQNFKPGHPPVVMISSVSREDSDLAFQALQLGASDYVEKPALAKLEECGEEIKVKVKAAVEAARAGININLDVEKSFSRAQKIKDPGQCAIVVVGPLSRMGRWANIVRDMGADCPPIYFCLEGSESGLPGIAKKLGQKISKVEVFSGKEIKPGERAVVDFKASWDSIKTLKFKKVAVLAYNGVSKKSLDKLSAWRGTRLFVEEVQGKSHPLQSIANDIVPATSFGYLCWKLFSE